MEKIIEYEMPFTSGDYNNQPFLQHRDGHLEIVYSYFGIQNIEKLTTILFSNVKAHKFTSTYACSPWQISDAMETLLHIKNSNWVIEINEAISMTQGHLDGLKHFLIFISDLGCIEVISTSYQVK